MGVFDTLDKHGTDVRADAAPPNGEIIDKSNVVGAVARYLGTVMTNANGRSTPKHVFRIPSGGQFALWGDAMLNSLLRKMKPNDVVGLIYDGKKTDDAGNDVHSWRLKLLTARGDTLASIVAQCEAEGVYAPMRAAIEQAKRAREAKGAQRGTQQDAPPPHSDDDLPW